MKSQIDVTEEALAAAGVNETRHAEDWDSQAIVAHTRAQSSLDAIVGMIPEKVDNYYCVKCRKSRREESEHRWSPVGGHSDPPICATCFTNLWAGQTLSDVRQEIMAILERE